VSAGGGKFSKTEKCPEYKQTLNTKASGNQKSFHDMIRQVIEACADCDTCRFLMDESCLFFQ
jgi:hypothetical protein